MSFSTDCKKQAVFAERESCCVSSFLYGVLSFAKSFSKNNITVWLPDSEISDKVLEYFSQNGIMQNDFDIEIKSSAIILKTKSKDINERIFMDFGYSGDEPNFRIKSDNFFCDACFCAFVAGAFISCGTVVDPESGYHMEFSTHKKRLFQDFLELLTQNGFSPKSTDRGYSKVIYFKDSTQIEDVLSFIGANDAMFFLINHKIYKDIRNTVNRRINCENANIDKLVKASSKDVTLFKDIDELKLNIPKDLYEVIKLRIQNPEMSLLELGKLCEPKLSKSGFNHRLEKARTFVLDIKEKGIEHQPNNQ